MRARIRLPWRRASPVERFLLWIDGLQGSTDSSQQCPEHDTPEEKGIPAELAAQMVAELGPDQMPWTEWLKEAVITASKCVAKGYSDTLALYCIRNKVNPDSVHVQVMEAIDAILENVGDENLVTAILSQEIHPDEVREILEESMEKSSDLEGRREYVSRKFREVMKNKCHQEVSGAGGEV